VGAQTDIGLPDGAALGVVVRPAVSWLRLSAAYTYALASGVRVGATLDPVNFPIAPTLTVEAGHAFRGTVRGQWIGMEDDAKVSYSYANLHLGLELGSRDRWRLYLRGGGSVLAVSTSDLVMASASGETVTARGTTVTASALGTAKLGFAMYF
jgi:hypothetical protein